MGNHDDLKNKRRRQHVLRAIDKISAKINLPIAVLLCALSGAALFLVFAMPLLRDGEKGLGNVLALLGSSPFFSIPVAATIALFGVNLNAFLWVYNVLDTKNEFNVNPGTGRANLDIFTSLGGQIIGLNTLEQYLNNPTSFSAPREVRFGLSLEF